jgi:hypothetical protein
LQIPGCGKDLSGSKRYYLRYRLCMEHLNMSCLIINGVPSRFCQKCVNFHELSSFDADKRCVISRLGCSTSVMEPCRLMPWAVCSMIAL